jgi:hypothetical protein
MGITVESEPANVREVVEAQARVDPSLGIPKLSWRKIRLRYERVECGIFERNFCKKYFGPVEASHIS